MAGDSTSGLLTAHIHVFHDPKGQDPTGTHRAEMEILLKMINKRFLIFLVFFMLVPSLSFADIPATNDAFVRWGEFKKAMNACFTAEEVGTFEKRLKPAMEANTPRALPEPFTDETKGFVHMGDARSFILVIVELIKPYLAVQDAERVSKFFEKLNKDVLVQGWASSRNYLGRIGISLELKTDSKGRYGIEAYLAPSDGPDRKNIGKTGGYRGITITFPTDIAVR
jgi:hypothetical protein